jgi:hypothetical protein
MRTALLLAALGVTALLPTSAATAGDPLGGYCAGAHGKDHTGTTPEPGAALLYSGPVLLDDDPAAQPVSGSVTCTLVAGTTHDSPVLASATSPTTPVVASLPPTVVPYTTVAPAPESLCTSVHVAGRGTLYLDPTATNAADFWTTDPSAPCVRPDDA